MMGDEHDNAFREVRIAMEKYVNATGAQMLRVTLRVYDNDELPFDWEVETRMPRNGCIYPKRPKEK